MNALSSLYCFTRRFARKHLSYFAVCSLSFGLFSLSCGGFFPPSTFSPPFCNLHRETFVIISPALTVGTQHLRSQGLAIMKPSSLIWVTWPNFIMGFNHQHFITRAPQPGKEKCSLFLSFFSLCFHPPELAVVRTCFSE